MPVECEIITETTSGHLAQRGAKIFSHAADESNRRSGRFCVALSGGSTPRTMHRTLSQEPCFSAIPWRKTHLFWVDERCVPAGDSASNYGTARKDFLDSAPIPPHQVHPMDSEASPEQGAAIYQRELRAFFGLCEGEFPVFDLVFLGIGKDGHTASLFPGQRALEEETKWVVAVKGGSPDVSRLTLTYPVLNHARRIVFLVSGKEKADIVKAILKTGDIRAPAKKIQPQNGKVTWLLDRDAASLLKPM